MESDPYFQCWLSGGQQSVVHITRALKDVVVFVCFVTIRHSSVFVFHFLGCLILRHCCECICIEISLYLLF